MSAPHKPPILVIGAGRLVTRVLDELAHHFGTNYEIVCIPSKTFKENEETDVQEASIHSAEKILRDHRIAEARAVVLADNSDEGDEINMHLLLTILKLREAVPIVATFFHDKIVSSLERDHRNVVIVNPAHVASGHIVDMIKKTTEPQKKWWLSRFLPVRHDQPVGRAVWLFIGFIALFFAGSGIFYFTQDVSVLQSIYLMVTIITSVNFNDAALTDATTGIRIAITILMLVTYVYVLYMLAVVIDELDKSRTEAAVYGRRKYTLSNHIIVCGLGRVGYALVDRLLTHKFKVLVFEKNPENDFVRQMKRRGVPVFIGDALVPENLRDAGISRGRALIAAVDKDFTNIKIALSARSLNPNIRVGLRIFEQEMAEVVRHRFKLHHAFSKSTLTAKTICARLERMLA